MEVVFTRSALAKERNKLIESHLSRTYGKHTKRRRRRSANINLGLDIDLDLAVGNRTLMHRKIQVGRAADQTNI